MKDIIPKTTYSPEEIQEKKQSFLEKKETLISYFNDLIKLLEQNGENPMSGEKRKIFMEKFSMIDHRLLDRFDVRSFEYYEAKENQE